MNNNDNNVHLHKNGNMKQQQKDSKKTNALKSKPNTTYKGLKNHVL